MTTPSKALEEFGLVPENYKFKRRVLPNGVRVFGEEVKPFPIMIIQDRDHEAWADKFRNEYAHLVEETIKAVEEYEGMPLFSREPKEAVVDEDEIYIPGGDAQNDEEVPF